jgi:hypothetical protein
MLRNQEEHGKNPARESVDEHRVLNAKSVSPELLAATIHKLSTKSSHNAAVSTTTIIMATISAIFPSVAGNPIDSTTTANSGNLTTTTRKFVKTTIKFKTQNLKALPSFGTIMPISGGSAMEFETKKQRNKYFRSVHTIINDSPAARPEWAKVPITFTEQDFKLKSAIHNDASTRYGSSR